MTLVRLFVDMVAARRVARHLEDRFLDLDDGDKWAVVEDMQPRDPRLAEGLRRVWHLA